MDFSVHHVATLVDDRVRWGESEPILTHVSDNGTVAHIVFPTLEGHAGVSYSRRTDLFLLGQLKAGGQVQVHTMCEP